MAICRSADRLLIACFVCSHTDVGCHWLYYAMIRVASRRDKELAESEKIKEIIIVNRFDSLFSRSVVYTSHLLLLYVLCFCSCLFLSFFVHEYVECSQQLAM